MALLDFFEKVKLKNSKFGRLNICRGSYFQHVSQLKGDVYKTMKNDHSRYKNDPLIAQTHLMTWPPLTQIFFAPRSLFHTEHVHSYSKKPRSLIRAKVEVSPFF